MAFYELYFLMKFCATDLGLIAKICIDLVPTLHQAFGVQVGTPIKPHNS